MAQRSRDTPPSTMDILLIKGTSAEHRKEKYLETLYREPQVPFGAISTTVAPPNLQGGYRIFRQPNLCMRMLHAHAYAYYASKKTEFADDAHSARSETKFPCFHACIQLLNIYSSFFANAVYA